MNYQDLENIIAIDLAGTHIGSGLSPLDYYMMHGTGAAKRREQEREDWNRAVETMKALKKEAKP